MTARLFVLVIVAVLIFGVEIYAHHSFVGTYLVEKEKIRTVEGKLVQVMIRNPHSFIHVEFVDENGQTSKIILEAQGATQAREYGGKQPLAVGDVVRASFNPARLAESHRGRLVTIVRPSDGWSWGTREGESVQ